MHLKVTTLAEPMAQTHRAQKGTWGVVRCRDGVGDGGEYVHDWHLQSACLGRVHRKYRILEVTRSSPTLHILKLVLEHPGCPENSRATPIDVPR